jgi:chromosome segregation ATPase
MELFVGLSLIVESEKFFFMTSVTPPDNNSYLMYPFHHSIFDHCVSIINTISTLESHLNPLFRAYAEELKLKDLECSEKLKNIQENLAVAEAQTIGAVAALEELQQKARGALVEERGKIGQQVKALETLRNKIKQYERSQIKSVSQKNQPTQKMLDDLRAKVRKLKKTNPEQLQVLEALQEQVKSLTAENADLKRQNKALREKLTASTQAHEEASATATQALAQKDAQITALQAALAQVTREKDEVSAQLAKQRVTFSEHLSNQATKDEQIQALQLVIPNLQQANADLAAQYHQLQTAHAGLQQANLYFAAQVQQMRAHIAHLQQCLNSRPVLVIPPGYAQRQPDARFGYSANTMGLFREPGGPARRGNAQAGQHVPPQHAKR